MPKRRPAENGQERTLTDGSAESIQTIDTLPNDYVASEQVLSLLLHYPLSHFKRSTQWDQGVTHGQGTLCDRSDRSDRKHHVASVAYL